MDDPKCVDYSQAASRVLTVHVPTDGSWSDEYGHEDNDKATTIYAISRPRIYYAEILDCEGSLLKNFSTGQFPRLTHEVHFYTQADKGEFSYEDLGLLRLYAILTILLGGLYCVMIKTFRRYL